MASRAQAQGAPPGFKAEARGVAQTVATALLIALVLRVLLFQPFTIPSDSMEPGLQAGDYMVASKFSYGWSRHSLPFSLPLFHGRILGREPRRGDVIVFKLPRDAGRTDYVKRLIGLPGDRVQLLDGRLLINGRAIPQQALGPLRDAGDPAREVQGVRETLDGRAYETLRERPAPETESTDVYVVPQGQYFFMGDNRDNSLDSRWPGGVGVGFVPAEDLVGRAEFVLLSWRRGASLWKPWTWLLDLDPARLLRRIR